MHFRIGKTSILKFEHPTPRTRSPSPRRAEARVAVFGVCVAHYDNVKVMLPFPGHTGWKPMPRSCTRAAGTTKKSRLPHGSRLFLISIAAGRAWRPVLLRLSFNHRLDRPGRLSPSRCHRQAVPGPCSGATVLRRNPSGARCGCDAAACGGLSIRSGGYVRE